METALAVSADTPSHNMTTTWGVKCGGLVRFASWQAIRLTLHNFKGPCDVEYKPALKPTLSTWKSTMNCQQATTYILHPGWIEAVLYELA